MLLGVQAQEKTVLAEAYSKPFNLMVVKIDSLNNASRDLTFVNPIKSLEFAKQAQELSEKNQYKKGEAYANRNLSNVYILNEVFYVGMQYLQTSEEIFKSENDSIGLADCYISYGHLYRNLGNSEKEIEYFELAYSFYQNKGFSNRLGVCALNLSESYFTAKNYEQSRKRIGEAIKLNTEARQIQVLSACYKVLGELEFIQDDFVKADEYFKMVLELSEQLGDNSQKIATIESLLGLSQIHGKYNDFNKQSDYLTRALQYALENNLVSEITEVYNQLILLNLKQNNLKKVNDYLLEYNSISDSIQTKRLSDKTNLVNNLIDAREIEMKNRFLEQTSQFQKNEIQKRNVLLMVIFSITLVLIFILIRLNGAVKKIKSQNTVLQEKNILIETQKRELSELLLTRDKMFSIVAHDLKSPFSSILGYSNFLIEEIDALEKDSIVDYAREIKESADSTYEMLNKLLVWAKNQMGGFVVKTNSISVFEAVSGAVSSLKKTADLKKIKLNLNLQENAMVRADYDMLATIIRNLIQNAIKYSHENDTVEIVAIQKMEEVEFCVTDHGTGMDKQVLTHLFDHEKEKIKKRYFR